jgi:hypothetical protein
MATTIETTLGEVVVAQPFLQRIAALPLRSKDVPDGLTPKAKYHIIKLARLVAPVVRSFTEEYALLFEAYGVERPARDDDELARLGPTVREVRGGTPEAEEFARLRKILDAKPVTLEWGPIRSSDIPLALAADVIGLGPLCELIEPEDDVPPAANR